MTTHETRPVDTDVGGYFQARPIDDVPQLLDKSYGLRYQVYCVEREVPARGGLPGGTRDRRIRSPFHPRRRRGCSRRTRGNGARREGQRDRAPAVSSLHDLSARAGAHSAATRLVEVGRLSVSRSYRRRADDDEYGVTKVPQSVAVARDRRAERRRARDGVFPTVLKALYQATKRMRRDALAGGDGAIVGCTCSPSRDCRSG